jgi:hypothetical protein
VGAANLPAAATRTIEPIPTITGRCSKGADLFNVPKENFLAVTVVEAGPVIAIIIYREIAKE